MGKNTTTTTTDKSPEQIEAERAAAEAQAAAAAADQEAAAKAAAEAQAAAAAAAAAAESAAKAADSAGLMGKVVRLAAVHGEIYHAFDATRFDVGDGVKHEYDAWVRVQVEAGKLRVVD